MVWEGDILVEYIVEYLPGQALLKSSKVTDMVCLRWTGWNAVLVNSDRNDGDRMITFYPMPPQHRLGQMAVESRKILVQK